MPLKVCLLIAIIFNLSYCLRLSRSAVWQPIPEQDKVKDKHDIAWSDWNDGHDSGYVTKKDGHQEKNSATFNHAVKEEAEEHALKSAAGVGKHASAAAKNGASKHVDQASIHGKDIKAKTFGFFDYQYKQPEYHVEQFYTDEKHRQKSGADRLHHSLKDHESDLHAASGWGKHGKGYHNDANGLKAHKHDGEFHNGWASNIHKEYEHGGEKDYSKGRGAHKGHYHHNIVPASPPPPPYHHHHHHHGHHDEWVAPYEHGYEHGSSPWNNPAEHDGWDKWHHGWEHGLD
ncbi:unnamed protein product [Cercopithifilaria johnstoni]|uniref:Uncharacterized protein n=1 Tax=Cercopithifilaria johnstoni TaxID=2874296 RepID=A0A8J2MMM8_9BILA|nr:unnamed protein product [Cercopithifilaria johnstoni]